MAREIKIRERATCPNGTVLKWTSTINAHWGMATECFDSKDDEIYEYDMVRVAWPEDFGADVGCVVFADGCFWVDFGEDGGMVKLCNLVESDEHTVTIVGVAEVK